MADLKDIEAKIARAFKARAETYANGSLLAKLAAAGLTSASAIAQFTGAEKLGASEYIGIGTAAAAALTALYLAYTDKDAPAELDTAREAIVLARELQDDANETIRSLAEYRADFDRYETEQTRANELYLAMFAMRGVIEHGLGADNDVFKTIELLMRAAERSLRIALGFQPAEYHTLCVYVAEPNPVTHKQLRCIAHSRTVDCEISEARPWPLGVGVAGAALARGTEVVVPDMTALQIGTLYRHNVKPEDNERYLSIAAVPVTVSGMSEPWGVVVGTSDRPNHFSVGLDEPGVQTVEAIRALAGMVALAVKADQTRRPVLGITRQNAPNS